MSTVHVDLHQHLWTAPFLECLRLRSTPPYLDGWTLHLDGEPPYEVRPADHDPAAREALVRADGCDLALISLSAPLGIEWLPPEEARPLLEAYHDGIDLLPELFGSWAAACLTDLDPQQLAKDLDAGCVGLQLPATAMSSPAALERCGPLLEVLQEHDKPLFVHPGAVGGAEGAASVDWWPALVPYVGQMHAAWFAFAHAGRQLFPDLRVCFAMLAGLAPAHLERYAARGGERRPVDRQVFLETSSYGVTAIDAMVRAVGVDALVLGSDRPYAEPFDGDVGSALTHAIRSTNPARLLGPRGARP